MTTRTNAPAGAPTWIDLASTDHARSLDFYSRLFGWGAETPDPMMGNYANFLRAGKRIAGSMPALPGACDAWTLYFAVDDVEQAAEATLAAGGVVHAPAMEVMDLGALAVLGDVGGSCFGVWRAGTHTGFPVVDEPAAPSWFELHTRAYDAVLEFYRTVFGWELTTVSDVPGFRYTVAMRDGEELLGIMDGGPFLPEGAPALWQTYINVEDVDATVALAVELGGSVAHPAEDTPYGRIAALLDPMGAAFKLRHA